MICFNLHSKKVSAFSLLFQVILFGSRENRVKKKLNICKMSCPFYYLFNIYFFKFHLLSSKHSKSLFSIIELNSVEDFVKFGLRYQSLQINISNYLSSYISF